MNNPPLELFRMLREAGVPFVVIGGHAVNVHGVLRATEDHDIVFLRTPDSEARLLKVLAAVRAQWILDEKDPATGMERTVAVTPEYLRSSHVMLLLTDKGFLDIFDHVPGIPGARVEDLLRDAVEVEGIRYASRDWLLKMKRAAGRTRDLLDIELLTEDTAGE